MLARFRKKKRFSQRGGETTDNGFDIPISKEGGSMDDALSSHTADQAAAADAKIAGNYVGGWNKRHTKRHTKRQYGGDKFTVPQDNNAGPDGNASMRNSSEMLAQSQADQKYDAAGGRKRRKTRRGGTKQKRKTKRRKRHRKRRRTRKT